LLQSFPSANSKKRRGNCLNGGKETDEAKRKRVRGGAWEAFFLFSTSAPGENYLSNFALLYLHPK